jgi:hypothetical protein
MIFPPCLASNSADARPIERGVVQPVMKQTRPAFVDALNIRGRAVIFGRKRSRCTGGLSEERELELVVLTRSLVKLNEVPEVSPEKREIVATAFRLEPKPTFEIYQIR